LWVFDLYRTSAEALRTNGQWEFDYNMLQGQTRGQETWDPVHHCVRVLLSAGPEGHVGRLKVAFYHFCTGLPVAASVISTMYVSLQSAALLPYACLKKNPSMILVLSRRARSTAARRAVCRCTGVCKL